MRSFIAAFARNSVFANILLLGFILAGVLAAKFMVRELFPEFSIEIVTVNVPYPGADPEEVEESICRKIEEAIDGLEGIKQYSTNAHENRGSALIEIQEDYDVAKAKDDIKTRIDAISNFPVDAEKPIVTQVTLKREVIVLALSGSLDERRLKEWAEEIKTELRNLDGVSQVSVVGARDYEIAVEVPEEKLREYGLSFAEIANAIRRSSLNQAGGTLRTENEEVRLRTMGRKYWGDEFGRIIVLAGPEGDSTTLDQIATIRDGFVEDQMDSTLNGEPAIQLLVSKTSEEDAIEISRQVWEYVEKKKETLPAGLNMTICSDTSDFINARISLLTRNGIIGLVLVLVLLWMFLDLRLSFWAAMGIPISLSGALALMWFMGTTINMISLFGLIMVIGIVVDDAIVVGEAIYVHRKRGDAKLDAAINGVVEVGLPVIAAVTTTIVAFIPLMFAGGIMGKFIYILPVAVICCLSISLIECLVMLPAHLSHLPDPDDPGRIQRQQRNPFRRIRRRISDGLEWFVRHIYMPFLHWVLSWRYVALCVSISILFLAAGLVRGGILKFVFFPAIDGTQLNATVEFPNGTPIDVVRDAVARIEKAIKEVADSTKTKSGDPLLEQVFALAGGSFDEHADGGIVRQPHVGAVRIEMLDSEFRGIHSKVIKSQWEERIGEIPGALSLSITSMEAGPPGKPIEIWLQGQDMETLLSAADDLIARLSAYDGVSQVESDFRPGKNEVRFTLKPEARALGLTVSDLAQQVYAGFYGEEALRLQRGRDDIRVRVRYPANERDELARLRDVRIRTTQGQEIPLRSVANMTYGPGYATITRTNGMRRVAVTADVDDTKANTEEILNELSKGYFEELKAKHPGLYLSVEGTKRDTAETMARLKVGFPLALVGIFVIVATIFRSYIQPLVIMVTVPFGIIGAMLGHLAMGYPLTIISMFGIVALSGVVVNDAIVLIECVNAMVAEGMPFFVALARGGARRFRAIFLTTVSTIGGLAPMLLEQDLQAQFLKPMAVSLAFGVAFATLLTLVLIPCLLGILNDLRRLLRALHTGTWPSPEEVEPARARMMDAPANPAMPVAEHVME